MKMEENESVARRWFEDVFNGKNLDIADEIVAPNHTLQDSANPEFPSGPEGTKQLVEKWHRHFDDAYITIEDQVVEGDKVVLRWTAKGQSSDELFNHFGIDPPSSPLPVEVMGITISRVSDGKIEETWNSFDGGHLLNQLGIFGDADRWPF